MTRTGGIEQSSTWLDTDTGRAEFLRQVDVRRYTDEPSLFANEVFPHRFSLPWARWHAETIRWLTGTGTRVREFGVVRQRGLPVGSPPSPVASEIVRAPAARKLALMGPRGHGKSELMSFLLPMWEILTNRKHFIIIVSHTETRAKDFLKPLKHEWESNERLRALLREITPDEEKWSETVIELRRGGQLAYRIMASGYGTDLRGTKFLHFRPDLVILDDAENDEMVQSDLRLADFQEWFDRVILHVDPNCDIVWGQTCLHERSLINRIIRRKDPQDASRYRDFEGQIAVALDAQGASTWPEKESTEELALKRELNPYSFAQEKQCEPVDPSYCPFKQEFFTERRFWTDLPRALSISITIDPAWTVRDYSKETAVVCAGWDAHGRLWVLDEHHGKYEDPSLILDLILDWYFRWAVENVRVNSGHEFFCVGFDAISAQKLLLELFRQRCQQRHLHPLLRELKADRDKIRRIWQLEPLFRHDRIFLRPDMVYLQHQLQGFPRNVRGGLCDVADALAYHLQLSQYLPHEEPDERVQARISFEDYANMHEDIRLYQSAFPDLDMVEAFGMVDGRLLASFARTSRKGL